MDVYSLPLPQDSKRDCQVIETIGSLKDELRKLQEKYGKNSIPILKEVENILELQKQLKGPTKYNKESNDINKEDVCKSQCIIRKMLRRKRFLVSASNFLQTPLASELNKRNEIWKDILVSERLYFQNLVLLFETYFMPLKMKTMGIMTQDQRILNEKQIYRIFQNIEDIKNTAKTMWKKLEEACKKWPETSPRIGGVFMSIISDIKSFYVVYIKGISKSLKNLAKIKKTNSQFCEFIERSESNKSTLPLYILLGLPSERLGKYDQNLKELYMVTPSDHIDYTDLVKAQKEISSLNSDLSSFRVESDKLEKIFRVNSTLKGTSPDLMQIKGDVRTLVREGPITLVSERKNRRGYIYLFTDVVVISEVNEKNEEKIYEQLISLNFADIKELQSQNEHFAFALSKENRRVVLSAFTQAERESWIKDISLLISKKKNV